MKVKSTVLLVLVGGKELTDAFACFSQGGKSGAVQKCSACRGRGVRIMIRQLAPGMVQQMQSVCSDCNGEGACWALASRRGGCAEMGRRTVLSQRGCTFLLKKEKPRRVLEGKCEKNYSVRPRPSEPR